MGANASMTLVLFLDITVATSKNRKWIAMKNSTKLLIVPVHSRPANFTREPILRLILHLCPSCASFATLTRKSPGATILVPRSKSCHRRIIRPRPMQTTEVYTDPSSTSSRISLPGSIPLVIIRGVAWFTWSKEFKQNNGYVLLFPGTYATPNRTLVALRVRPISQFRSKVSTFANRFALVACDPSPTGSCESTVPFESVQGDIEGNLWLMGIIPRPTSTSSSYIGRPLEPQRATCIFTMGDRYTFDFHTVATHILFLFVQQNCVFFYFECSGSSSTEGFHGLL